MQDEDSFCFGKTEITKIRYQVNPRFTEVLPGINFRKIKLSIEHPQKSNA